MSRRFHQEARKIADRHYSRVKIGSADFVGNGRPLVLLAPHSGPAKALWVTLWQSFVRHGWVDAWQCTLFRNEGAGLSSELIVEAVAATRAMWGEPPPNGIITFIDRAKTRPKKDAGYCYRMAGWRPLGRTKGGLVVLGQRPEDMPSPVMPIEGQLALFKHGVAPSNRISANCKSPPI